MCLVMLFYIDFPLWWFHFHRWIGRIHLHITQHIRYTIHILYMYTGKYIIWDWKYFEILYVRQLKGTHVRDEVVETKLNNMVWFLFGTHYYLYKYFYLFWNKQIENRFNPDVVIADWIYFLTAFYLFFIHLLLPDDFYAYQ